MAQPKPCVVCLEPLTNYSTLRCCGQPCHPTCAYKCQNKKSLTQSCPSCYRVVPITVDEVLHEEWKEDFAFVQQVKALAKDNPLWYGICYDFTGKGQEGFWEEHQYLNDDSQPQKILYFRGKTKTQVIRRMKEMRQLLEQGPHWD